MSSDANLFPYALVIVPEYRKKIEFFRTWQVGVREDVENKGGNTKVQLSSFSTIR